MKTWGVRFPFGKRITNEFVQEKNRMNWDELFEYRWLNINGNQRQFNNTLVYQQIETLLLVHLNELAAQSNLNPKQTFQIYDLENKGNLDFKQFEQFLIQFDPRLTKKEIISIFLNLDKDQKHNQIFLNLKKYLSNELCQSIILYKQTKLFIIIYIFCLLLLKYQNKFLFYVSQQLKLYWQFYLNIRLQYLLINNHFESHQLKENQYTLLSILENQKNQQIIIEISINSVQETQVNIGKKLNNLQCIHYSDQNPCFICKKLIKE